jgi:hypothetical protein
LREVLSKKFLVPRRKSAKKNYSGTIVAKAKRKPESRRELLATYYKVPAALIAELAVIKPEKRKDQCKEHGITPQIFRTMMDYNRYREAGRIHRQLVVLDEPIKNLSVLDFGCLVSDYGMYFARLGAKVAIYDKRESALKFARFRFAAEKLGVKSFPITTAYKPMAKGRDLVIFGEVLEHMDNPLEVLQACVAHKVKYIFTSHYPFGDDKYFALSGHSRIAEAQQPACIKLLDDNYTGWILHDRAMLWQRKKGK